MLFKYLWNCLLFSSFQIVMRRSTKVGESFGSDERILLSASQNARSKSILLSVQCIGYWPNRYVNICYCKMCPRKSANQFQRFNWWAHLSLSKYFRPRGGFVLVQHRPAIQLFQRCRFATHQCQCWPLHTNGVAENKIFWHRQSHITNGQNICCRVLLSARWVVIHVHFMLNVKNHWNI